MRNGYTLIELVVVIALTAILLFTATSLFYTTILAGGKTVSAEAVKQAGQVAIEQMSFLIRNARKLSPDTATGCVSSAQTLTIQNQDGSTTLFSGVSVLGGNVRLASNSAYLTPSTMTVKSGPTFTCAQQNDGGPPTITIDFTLQKGIVGVDKSRDIVSIPFQTRVTLRNE